MDKLESPRDIEAEVIAAAWDCTIIRSDGPSGPLFFFSPPVPSDGQFAKRVGVRLGLGANARVIYQPSIE